MSRAFTHITHFPTHSPSVARTPEPCFIDTDGEAQGVCAACPGLFLTRRGFCSLDHTLSEAHALASPIFLGDLPTS